MQLIDGIEGHMESSGPTQLNEGRSDSLESDVMQESGRGMYEDRRARGEVRYSVVLV